MSLLQALNLTLPAKKAGAGGPPPVHANDAAKATASRSEAKAPKGVVVDGEPQVTEEPVIRKFSMGIATWQHQRVELLGYTDEDGNVVTQPRSPGWKKMGIANVFFRRGLYAIENANALNEKWRAELKEVQAGMTRGKDLLARVHKAADAISERKRTDPTFQKAVNDYFRQVDSLPRLKASIGKASSHFREANDRLQSTILGTKIDAKNDDIADLKDQEADVEKERANAKAIFGEVLSLAGTVANFDPEKAATSAISVLSSGLALAGNLLIDGVYDGQIQILEMKLDDAKTALRALKSEKYKADIDAAQEVVVQAVEDCSIAANDFVAALKEAARLRAAAADAGGANKGDTTAVVAETMALRSRQQAALDGFTTAAGEFVKLADGLLVDMRQLGDMQAYVGEWIDDIGSHDDRLKAGKAWAKQAEWVGASNAYTLAKWIDSVPMPRDECRKAVAVLSGKGGDAAMAPYVEALSVIETAMTVQAKSTQPVIPKTRGG